MSKNTTTTLDLIIGKKKQSSTVTFVDCVICNKPIKTVRLKALRMLGTPINQWAHTNCSQTTKVKGIYMGEVGTSKLQLCDKVYNDSVRSVFRYVAADEEDTLD